MTYASLMVHLELDQPNDARVAVGMDLAELFDATLIGIAAADWEPPYYAEGALAHDLGKARVKLEKQLEELEQRFATMTAGRPVTTEWRSAIARPLDYVCAEARSADLVIATSNPGGAAIDLARQLDPGLLVMQVGRPVLIVPPEIDGLSLDSALVCWKDTRESRRALWNALPLLQHVKTVNLVEVIEQDTNRNAALKRVTDVVNWLGRHGVDGCYMVPTDVEDAPRRLATLADELEADVVIAGAYGHARLREWMFGGVSRDLLTRSKRCALLSH